MKASLLLLEGERPDTDLVYYSCQGVDLRKLTDHCAKTDHLDLNALEQRHKYRE